MSKTLTKIYILFIMNEIMTVILVSFYIFLLTPFLIVLFNLKFKIFLLPYWLFPALIIYIHHCALTLAGKNELSLFSLIKNAYFLIAFYAKFSHLPSLTPWWRLLQRLIRVVEELKLKRKTLLWDTAIRYIVLSIICYSSLYLYNIKE